MTGEGGFGGTAAESLFRGKKCKIGIVVLLRHVSENEIAGITIETIGIAKVFADCVIGKMASARKYELLDDPRIRADFEHVEVVVGFEDETISFAEVDFDELRHVAEVGANRYFRAIGTKGEADGVGSVVGDGEGMNIYIADCKALARLNRFYAVETLAKCVGKATLKRGHGGFSDVKRSFPETEDLRKAVAVIGVLMSD